MHTKIVFERVEPKSNTINNIDFRAITIDSNYLEYTDQNDASSENAVVDLSNSIRNWILNNVVEIKSSKYSYRFKDIPYLIPIIIDVDSTIPIDIKQAIGFQSLNDPVQKIFTWDIHSMVLYDEETDNYSSLIKDDIDEWYIISDNYIPANRKVDMSDSQTINKIARQIKMVFYRIK